MSTVRCPPFTVGRLPGSPVPPLRRTVTLGLWQRYPGDISQHLETSWVVTNRVLVLLALSGWGWDLPNSPQR